MSTERFAIVMPAAGKSTRFGGGDKLLSDLRGQTVLQRAVALFVHRADVACVVIPTGPERMEEYRVHLAALGGAPVLFVAGGRERWESVLNGLAAVPTGVRYVGVHDAARPLTPSTVIDAAFAGAVKVGGALPLLAEPATLKRVGPDGLVETTVSRAGLFQAQTPQCFLLEKLRAAYLQLRADNRLADVTDDAQVFERVGLPVLATPASPVNLKITTAGDVDLARALLA